MLRVGFIFSPDPNWMGGVNYYLSLLRGLDKEIQDENVVVFTDSSKSKELLGKLNNISVVVTPVLKRTGLRRFIYRCCNKIFGENSALFFILKRYRIDLLSHHYFPKYLGVSSMPWIPDFQHKVLPHYFTDKKIAYRDRVFSKYLRSQRVLFSSESAKKDALSFYSVEATPYVYRFPSLAIEEFDEAGYQDVVDEFKVKAPFVFLPNQFWVHKNHLTVLKALVAAVKKGRPFTLVCSGAMVDYRNTGYAQEILEFIQRFAIQDHVKLVGVLKKEVLNVFYRESALLINPSRFEGWSTTVEEGKALGKRMVLSDIPVHREQVNNNEKVGFAGCDDVNLWEESIFRLLNEEYENEKRVVYYEKNANTSFREVLLKLD